MVYRTKTYIAGEWDGDQDAIEQLHIWNESKHWNLSFTDAHDITQARDNSLNCSIKESLARRLKASKRFVLIVGENTRSARSGSCQYCDSYNSWTRICGRNNTIDHRSYIQYECDKAFKDELEIIVLYNSNTVDKSKCPDALKYVGKHIAMRISNIWNYPAVKEAFN